MRYLILLVSLFFSYTLFAQEEGNKELTGTPYGFYLTLEGMTDQSGYEVFRRGEKKEYDSLGVYNPVSSAADLYRRMRDFAGIFPYYGSPKAAFADTIWNRYQADRESLSQVSYPIMHLALGFAFLDTTAIPGETYQYMIRVKDSGKEITSERGIYDLDEPRFGEMDLYRVRNVGRSVRLEWSVSEAQTPPFFNVYRKQAAGKGSFRKIDVEKGTHTNNAGDSTVFIAIDSTGTVGISYEYYLASVDYLGNEGNHSDTVRIQLGGRQNVPAVYNLKTRSDSLGVRLSWRKLSPNPSLQNILILRSEHYDTGYSLLRTLPVDEVEFVDRNVMGGKLYYYQLIVQGSANYSIPTPRVSGIFRGKMKLDAPYALRSRSEEGAIGLEWKYRQLDRIKGFRVFRSLHPLDDFELIGELDIDSTVIRYKDTTVMDENTDYYYSIAAVSRTSHLSPSSTVVSGRPLGKASVEAPTRLRSLWLNDTTVSITWSDLQEGNPAVTGYQIYKNAEEPEAYSEEYLQDSVAVNEFVDVISPGETAWYWVKAIDGRDSEGGYSSPIKIKGTARKPLPPEVKATKQEEGVLLSWDAPLNHKLKQYNIYRAVNEEEVALLGSIKGEEETIFFLDDGVNKEALYFYYVTAVDQYDVESNQSDEVHVRFE